MENALIKENQTESNVEKPLYTNHDKFITLYNKIKKGKQVDNNKEFTDSEVTEFLDKHIEEIIKSSELSIFSTEVIAKICCKKFPKHYFKSQIGAKIEDFAIKKFSEIFEPSSSFHNLSSLQINACIEYLKDNVETNGQSEYVRKFCLKLLETPLFVSKDNFESCMDILISNFHDDIFSDLYEIFANISDFKKIKEIPQVFVPEKIKAKCEKLKNKLTDANIIKDWRDEYYNYAAKSLSKLSGIIDNNFDFSKNLIYLKDIIKIIHDDNQIKDHLESFILTVYPKIKISTKSEVQFTSNFTDFFNIAMLCMQKEQNQKQLISNLNNFSNISTEMKIDIMKHYLDKANYVEVKVQIASLFVEYLKDSEIEDRIKENLQKHVFEYICSSNNNNVLQNFLDTYNSTEEKAEICKKILESLKNDNEKILELKSLITFCFNAENQTVIGDATIKDLIVSLSSLKNKDNILIEYFSKLILDMKFSDEIRECVLNKFYNSLSDDDKKKFIKTLFNNNNSSFENLTFIIGDIENIKRVISLGKSVNSIKMIGSLVDSLFKLENSDTYVTAFIRELLNQESTKEDSTLFEKIIEKLNDYYDSYPEIITKSFIAIALGGSEESKKNVVNKFFNPLDETKKIDFVKQLWIENENSLERTHDSYREYYLDILTSDQAVSKLKEFINSKDSKGFKDLFFENEKLSLDNQKAIIDYFFERIN